MPGNLRLVLLAILAVFLLLLLDAAEATAGVSPGGSKALRAELRSTRKAADAAHRRGSLVVEDDLLTKGDRLVQELMEEHHGDRNALLALLKTQAAMSLQRARAVRVLSRDARWVENDSGAHAFLETAGLYGRIAARVAASGRPATAARTHVRSAQTYMTAARAYLAVQGIVPGFGGYDSRRSLSAQAFAQAGEEFREAGAHVSAAKAFRLSAAQYRRAERVADEAEMTALAIAEETAASR